MSWNYHLTQKSFLGKAGGLHFKVESWNFLPFVLYSAKEDRVIRHLTQLNLTYGKIVRFSFASLTLRVCTIHQLSRRYDSSVQR